ncbi:MAG: phenylacetate--CoA ligase family protein, partial [Deltaproteobacteria bacterium]|nr:phenylacetate--CoA ligase family protein [Deltaproteobacteria bacterium]
ISMWTDDPCSCGRTYPRLPKGIYGRADDMFIVRGENVYPSAIENVIRGIEGLGDEFRIVITREKTMDELIVRAERKPEFGKETVSMLQKTLEVQLREKGLRAIVQILNPDTLERTEFKAKRVIDQRDLYDELREKKGS